MQASPLFPQPNGPVKAEELLYSWRRECAALPSVQAMTSTTEASLLTVLQHILAESGDVNVDHQDVWEVLAGATSLQFGMTTAEGYNRAKVAGEQLWANLFVLGDAALPPHRILLAIQSGMDVELEMDELTEIVENVLRQTGEQAEVVFGHGLNPALSESIQVLLLVARTKSA